MSVERIVHYPGMFTFADVKVRFNIEENTDIFMILPKRTLNRETMQFEDELLEYHCTGELHEFLYEWLQNKNLLR